MPTVEGPRKEIREIGRRLKKGYELERTRGDHFRVRDPEGEIVKVDGKVLSIAGTPSDHHALQNTLANLRNAGALRETTRHERVPADEAARRRREGQQKMNAARAKARQREISELYDRLTAALKPVGGFGQRGIASDLAYIGAMISRENGSEPLSPDLLTSSIHRVKQKGWTIPKYQEIWNEIAERLEHADDATEEFFRLVRLSRGLPEQVVVDRPRDTDPSDWPFEVLLLPINQLTVDHSYQRPVPWPFVRKLAAQFDDRLVGTIDVSERHHGATFAILDGQLRFESMRMVGKRTVWCSIYRELDLQEEARFFLHKNQDRKQIHPFHIYKAKLTAGDPEATAIAAITKRYGYRVSITSAAHSEENISAISSLERAYRLSSDTRGECLTPTLTLLSRTTRGRRNGQAAVLINGLARFFSLNHEELDLERLETIVIERGPDWLIGKARETSSHMASRLDKGFVLALVTEYNKGLSPKQKLAYE